MEQFLSHASTEQELSEAKSFKECVQGSKKVTLTNQMHADLIHASASEIASSLGLSKGLIRTTESNESITQEYARSLFGGDDENPAKRQRLKREQTAQRAIERAKEILLSRAGAAAAANGVNNNNSNASSGAVGNSFADMKSRFSSAKQPWGM